MKLVISSSKELSPFESEAIALCIQERIFNLAYYDITTVRELTKTLGLEWKLASKEFQALKLLHCVPYSAMSNELRINTWQKTLDFLGISLAPVETKKYEAEVKVPQRWLTWRKK